MKRSMKMRQVCEDEASDASLEIEGKNTYGLDEEDEPPPSSSAFSLLQNVPDSNAPEAPSLPQLAGDHSIHDLDMQGHPTTLSRSVERVLSKLHPAHPNRDHLLFLGKSILPGSPLAPTSRRENVDFRASSSSHSAVAAKNPTTNLLQSTSPSAKKGSKVKDGLPAKGTRRQANGAGVPANPLARRQDTHSLREREKKRQRLTLGEGDG
ncbi:hypothetical protein DFH11DRAFT_1219437 [Phellopilus nigrolimitatus]|nr:hypothetical protein DFH11DRAFT_1219437 [Phellopilus nigrolimitatus]